ncbi:MAG: hypothetical protein Q9191_002689 [Dirinaria sp. TL-2023a]
MTGKRKRQEQTEDASASPKRVRTDSIFDQDGDLSEIRHEETPTKHRRGRPPGSGRKKQSSTKGHGVALDRVPPMSNGAGRLLFTSPTKGQDGKDEDEVTPRRIVRSVDSSARRKSIRNAIERTIADQSSDEYELAENENLAQKIWHAELAEEEEEAASASEGDHAAVEDELNAEHTTPTTPSKGGRKRARRKKSPTPPMDLAPHEQYFFQNRPGRVKTSNNSLSSLSLLTHEEYHNQISKYKDPHTSSQRFLRSLHSRSFPQWYFELHESFNICLCGYGSKRELVNSFAEYLYARNTSHAPKILIVNGYTPTLTLRHILNLLASHIYDHPPPKLPSQPIEAVSSLLAQLSTQPPETPIHLFINSLDAPPLRRAPAPMLLAQLATCPHIRLLATCDQPNFPLLWDTNLLEQYNWVYHDTTTFVPYAGVEVPAVLDDVNELLGRSGRAVKGKEGVGFVLRSLPENARNLYRVLVAEILAAGAEAEDAGLGSGGSDEGDGAKGVTAGGGGGGKASGTGVEYRVLYQKVVEEFICSSEMAFRQLLKEFHDHDMLVSRRDGAGTEVLGVPFRKEELEAILEDLMG